MRKNFSSKFNKLLYEIFAGEYYVSTNLDSILTTLLGSCVAVCLVDRFNRVAGINHIMISSKAELERRLANPDARYGIHAMELLINDMLKEGAARSNLEAKVFGGGNVLGCSDRNVGYANVDFAVSYLQQESIPILARDTGGESGRKIYFFPQDFSVYLRRIEMEQRLEETKKEELKYLNSLNRKSQNDNLTLFD
ncbi:MAG: chemotaxis protein CheD [Bacillota bacterium]